MKTYWDLSEKERSALTREDVERYIDAELMLKGVLKVAPLAIEPEPTTAAPTRAFYQIRSSGGFHRINLAFKDEADARAFLALYPLVIDHRWMSSETVDFVRDIEKPEIVAECIYTEAEIGAQSADLQRRAATKEENEQRKTEHAAATKKQEEALAGLWDDWYECQGKARRLQKIVDTFNDYVKTAGDTATAAKFLRKVFTVDAIAEAVEWSGVAIPSELAA